MSHGASSADSTDDEREEISEDTRQRAAKAKAYFEEKYAKIYSRLEDGTYNPLEERRKKLMQEESQKKESKKQRSEKHVQILTEEEIEAERKRQEMEEMKKKMEEEEQKRRNSDLERMKKLKEEEEEHKRFTEEQRQKQIKIQLEESERREREKQKTQAAQNVPTETPALASMSEVGDEDKISKSPLSTSPPSNSGFPKNPFQARPRK